MAFSSIRIEGAILSPDILEQIAQGTRSHQESDSFGFASRTAVKDEIQFAWGEAVHHWKIYRQRLERLRKSETIESVTRKFWVVPLLDLLGYELESAEAETVAGKNYAISHRVPVLGGYPIQIVGCDRELDKRATDGGPRLSPHGLLQEYLNVTEHLYGIVTNGETLRLLRDNSRLIRLSYLEFDLRRMMDEDQYGEFALLYRLLHQSRMPRHPAGTGESILERYHQDSLDDGARIRERLSAAVEKSLVKLGTGLLRHPANTALRERAEAGGLAPRAYLQTLFHEIYRVLFLMVLEERDLIFPEGTETRLREVYYRYYSLRKVRMQSEQIPLFPERHSDLWLGLRETFRLFSPGGQGGAMGVPPLGGELFSDAGLTELHDWELDNKTVLDSFALLNSFEDPDTHVRIRVNYASLNVEEFGSVYESLLEREGRFVGSGVDLAFQLVKGDERGETGSHYTPDTLVVPLIQHSLDHLIEARMAASNDAKVRESSLLALRICDPSCGSGHILLNAARRLGLELARVRTGEDQPAPSAIRWAVRDVIARCIYGVDKNPLAVELCKVALWLESHTPGEPLGFLDHRIKCGDAVVGLCRREELERGISEEAFAAVGTLTAEDKKVLTAMRKRLAQEKRVAAGVQAGTELFASVGQTVTDLLQKLSEIDALPEHTPDEVEHKAGAYRSLVGSPHWKRLQTLADVQVGQFFVPKSVSNSHLWVSESEYRRELAAPGSIAEVRVAVARREAVARRFFHWFLEFPEVFARGGFDCVLGNPPFLGYKGISGAYGADYLHCIMAEFACGSIDYSGFFFRRVFSTIKLGGFFGLIATNTISQGGTREGGLAVIVEQGGTLVHAVRSVRWPGKAAVQVSVVNVVKGPWLGRKRLDGRDVDVLSTYLDDCLDAGDPLTLNENDGLAFSGVYVHGPGFIIQKTEAAYLIGIDVRNSEVIDLYLNGEDLNGSSDQSASRCIINFRNYTRAVAETYPECWRIVAERVKPARDAVIAKGKQIHTYNFWEYWDRRPNLQKAIESLDRVLVVAQVSKTLAFSFVSKRQVLDAKLIVFATDQYDDFAVLQSNFHGAWAWKYCTTMKSDLSYGPNKILMTFPFPRHGIAKQVLSDLGSKYHEFRRDLMSRFDIGLTKIYNQFHNSLLPSSESDGAYAVISANDDKKFEVLFGRSAFYLKRRLAEMSSHHSFGDVIAGVLELRNLHKRMDEAVLVAYGWNVPGPDGPAIRLDHGFHEVEYLPENDRVRYTISPAARKEILRRLLLLNHKRHAEEVARGGGKASWTSEDEVVIVEELPMAAEPVPAKPRGRTRKSQPEGQEELGL